MEYKVAFLGMGGACLAGDGREASGTLSLLTTGTPGTGSCFIPQNLSSFKNSTKSWVGFSGGQHHTVCMDSEGRIPTSSASLRQWSLRTASLGSWFGPDIDLHP